MLNHKYFMCSFDSKKHMEIMFELLKEQVPEGIKYNMRKYSSDDPIDFQNASKEL